MGTRVKRFSAVIDDGVVKSLNFEPEGGKGIQTHRLGDDPHAALTLVPADVTPSHYLSFPRRRGPSIRSQRKPGLAGGYWIPRFRGNDSGVRTAALTCAS